MLVRFFPPLLGLLVAAATPGVPVFAQSAPESTNDTAVATKLATKLIMQVQSGKVDRALLTPAFSEDLSDSVVANYAGFLNDRGKAKIAGLLQRNDLGDDIRYVFLVTFDNGAVACTFGIDKSTNLIDALYFRPANPEPQPS
jgi:hypothetical protein